MAASANIAVVRDALALRRSRSFIDEADYGGLVGPLAVGPVTVHESTIAAGRLTTYLRTLRIHRGIDGEARVSYQRGRE